MRKLSYEQLLILSLMLLFCGICVGQRLPRDGERTLPAVQQTVAALPLATAQPQAVAALSYTVVDEMEPSATQVATAKPALDAAAPSLLSPGFATNAPTDPAPFDAAPQLTPAPVTESLFAVTKAPQATFAIEVIRTGDEAARPKSVLIYHTHTYEAYQKTEGMDYRETETWRTADERYNVVRVGEELAALLRGLGVSVTHDTTAFEPPELSSAYKRSLEMLERRAAAGERYDLYIDLHRDAYGSAHAQPDVVGVGSGELARLMLLVGKGDGQTSADYDQKPDWESNLQLAQHITDGLNAQQSGLCKNVMVKSGRYNQHVAPCCILVEAGNNHNTLEQVLASMPYLADAIFETLGAPEIAE